MDKTAMQQMLDALKNNDHTWLDYHVRMQAVCEKLLAIEKQQIIEAWENGFDPLLQTPASGIDYYNSKYKTL